MSIISCFLEFKWLYLKDPFKPLVASYHRRKRNLCFIEDPLPVSLEILPQGHHMVVLIVVTPIFVDKLRDKRNIKGGRIYEGFISYLLLSCELEGDINSNSHYSPVIQATKTRLDNPRHVYWHALFWELVACL